MLVCLSACVCLSLSHYRTTKKCPGDEELVYKIIRVFNANVLNMKLIKNTFGKF